MKTDFKCVELTLQEFTIVENEVMQYLENYLENQPEVIEDRDKPDIKILIVFNKEDNGIGVVFNNENSEESYENEKE